MNAWARRFTTTACVGGTGVTAEVIPAQLFPTGTTLHLDSVAVAGENIWVSSVVDRDRQVANPSGTIINLESTGVLHRTGPGPTSAINVGGPLTAINDDTDNRIVSLDGRPDGTATYTTISQYYFRNELQTVPGALFNAPATGTQPTVGFSNDQEPATGIIAGPGETSFVLSQTSFLTAGPDGNTNVPSQSWNVYGFIPSQNPDPIDGSLTYGSFFSGRSAVDPYSYQRSPLLDGFGASLIPGGIAVAASPEPPASASFIVRRNGQSDQTRTLNAITEPIGLGSGSGTLAVLGKPNTEGNFYVELYDTTTLARTATRLFSNPALQYAKLVDGDDGPHLISVYTTGDQTAVDLTNLQTGQLVSTTLLEANLNQPVAVDYADGVLAIATPTPAPLPPIPPDTNLLTLSSQVASNQSIAVARIENPAGLSTVRLAPINIDTDGDGLPDCVETGGWEVNGTTLTSDPDTPHSDDDGLTDGQETRLLTAEDMSALPNVNLPADFFKTAITELVDGVALVIPYSNPRADDTDNDGLTDPQEQAAGTDAFLPDTDDDGSPDWAEVDRGSDPLTTDENEAYALAFQPDTIRTGARAATCVENGGNVFLDEPIWVESRGEYVSGCWYIEDCVPNAPLVGGLQKWSCNNQSGLKKALVASIAVTVVLACVATACYVVAGPAAGSLAAQTGAVKVATAGGAAAIGTGLFAVTTSSELAGTVIILGVGAVAQAAAGADMSAGFDLADSFDRSVNRILELQPGTDPELARALVRECQDSKIAEQAERLGKFDRASATSEVDFTGAAYRRRGMTLPTGILSSQGGQHACELLPIYFPGEVSIWGAPQWQTTQHIREALQMAPRETVPVGNPPRLQSFAGLKENPLWATLTRRQGDEDRRLLDYANNGCAASRPAKGLTCDEFPFNATWQGRADIQLANSLPIGEKFKAIVASLKETDINEISHGRDLNSFYGAQNGCNVGDRDAFGVIPIPRLDLPGIGTGPPTGNVVPTVSLRYCPEQ